jgi:acetyltransferase
MSNDGSSDTPQGSVRNVQPLSGLQYYVRPPQPQDKALIEDFIRRLSPEDRRFRFFSPVGDVSGFVDRLTRPRSNQEILVIATSITSPPEVLAAAGFYSDADDDSAEFGIIVRSDLKGQGMGFTIMTYLFRKAPSYGVRRLWGLILRDNADMLDLVTSLGMRIESSPDGNILRAVIDL